MIFQPLLILCFTHGQRIARTTADEQMAVFQNGFILMPGGEIQQRVLTDDKGQRLVWSLFSAPLLQRLRRPGGGVAAQLALIKAEEWFIRDGQGEHRFSLLTGCFGLRTMRRDIIGHNDNAVKTNQIRQNFNRLQMPVMYRVESATIQGLERVHTIHR